MANPVLAQSDGSHLSYVIDFPPCRSISCLGETKYHFYNPNNIKRGQHLFEANLTRPSCCGTAELPLKDKSGTSVMTPTIEIGLLCVNWKIKNGAGEVVGYVKSPTCAQKCQGCLVCWDSVLLRGTDEKDVQRFTLRNFGCCGEFGKCDLKCCDFGKCCEDCKQCKCKCHDCSCDCKTCDCKCRDLECGCKHLCDHKPFNYSILVYSGDMAAKDPVAMIRFEGKLHCCTMRLLQGYRCHITFPPNCTYNDTCILILMAMYLDEAIIDRYRGNGKEEEETKPLVPVQH